MSILLAAMTAAIVTGQLNQPYIGTPYGGLSNQERTLVYPPPYPYNIADSVRRPGFGGKLWISSNTIIGGQPSYRYGPVEPGAAYYGAPERSNGAIAVRVEHLITTVGPWQRIGTVGPGAQGNLARMERGRQQWLREYGYTGGTRTFVNAALISGERTASTIRPRATIILPPDATRLKRRLEVRADEPYRISWPPQTSVETLIISSNLGTLMNDDLLALAD